MHMWCSLIRTEIANFSTDKLNILFWTLSHYAATWVYVCVCLYYDLANGSIPLPDRVVETRWGQGSLVLVLQANNGDSSCIHIIHCMRRCLHFRSFDPDPCYCPWSIYPSGGSPTWPKFNVCKQVTQRPLVEWVDTFHGGLGSLKAQGSRCVYVWCVCVYGYMLL